MSHITPMRAAKTAAGPEGLVDLPLDRLHPHPSNANAMTEAMLTKLARHVEREGRYPPLIVRPHPRHDDAYELLDGHQRCQVLRRLGYREATCLIWPCDDATALTLLATLNRLEGGDERGRRAELVAELQRLAPSNRLAELLPESGRRLQALLQTRLDRERLQGALRGQDRPRANVPRRLSFTVPVEDGSVIEAAIAAASGQGETQVTRADALVAICRAYLEAQRD